MCIHEDIKYCWLTYIIIVTVINYILLVIIVSSGAVLAVRAMMILALITGLIGWVVSMVCLVLHRPKFLFTASFAYGLQGQLIHYPSGTESCTCIRLYVCHNITHINS